MKSLIHLILLLPTVIATQSEAGPVNGELVVVHQVSADGSVLTPGKPHVVIVAEEEDDLDALLLEGFDFDDADVVSLCPVEAACARNPATTTITTTTTIATTNTATTTVDATVTGMEKEQNNEPKPRGKIPIPLPHEPKSPPPSQAGEGRPQDSLTRPNVARDDKNSGDDQTCLEVIVMRGEERCVIWRGKEKEDGSSQRIVRRKGLSRT